MISTNKRPGAALLALLAIGFALPESAEARRYRPVIRRAPAVYGRRPVVINAPFVGVRVGAGRVRVAAPGVGVFVGW